MMSKDDSVSEPSTASKPRKERVLHTRVPAVLDQELKRLAENLRIPVSNLVRTILQDALEAMDMVGERAEGELRGAADRLKRSRARMRPDGQQPEPSSSDDGPVPAEAAPVIVPADVTPSSDDAVGDAADVLAGVLGFQPLTLARATRCAVCGEELRAGSQAFLGITQGTHPGGLVVGASCLPGTS
jgi:hypothetical protein